MVFCAWRKTPTYPQLHLGLTTPLMLQGVFFPIFKWGDKSTYSGYNPSYPFIGSFIGVVTPLQLVGVNLVTIDPKFQLEKSGKILVAET